MIIVCHNCATRLQVEDGKVPARPFTLRCPKCDSSVDSGPVSPASERSGLALGGSPATAHRRFEQPNPAPGFEPEVGAGQHTDASDAERLAQMLATLLGQSRAEGPGARPAWSRRKALVCSPEGQRDQIARQLAEDGYQVFVAQDTRQAVDRMRENALEIVLLDLQFDPVEQGAAFVMREVNVLRPAERRRLFFVLLSPSLRTMDAHAAFLNNVNAIINLADVSELPAVLNHAVREYNELYKDFNSALRVGAL